MEDICSWKRVKWLDNWFRRLIHNPLTIYKPYVVPGNRAMDIGCGAGFTSIGLAKLVGESGQVVSVDVQPEMLEIVRDRAVKAGLADRIHTHLSEPDSLGVDGQFDFANAFWMVHEVPDMVEFFQQVHAHLKDGGMFFIAEPMVHHVSKDDFEKMIEVAREVGFEVHSRPRIRFSRTVVLKKG